MIKLDKFLSICFRNRRRLVKEKRVTGSKIEKLMDVLPQAIFSSGMAVSAVHFVFPLGPGEMLTEKKFRSDGCKKKETKCLNGLFFFNLLSLLWIHVQCRKKKRGEINLFGFG